MMEDKIYSTNYHQTDVSDVSILLTGGAGFIGSNILEYLITFGFKKVYVLDNLSSGFVKNIEKFIGSQVEFIEGDIRDFDLVSDLTKKVDYVIHQAALGSVPRSINAPLPSHDSNINGFLNVLEASRLNGVKRMVYASSSSVYGDHPALPKKEENTGNPLSPYAVTKCVNELYANVYHSVYGFKVLGLRYFNVFGPNQSPEGQYAAVIPLFVDAILNGKQANIHGDGEQTRDFTFVENAVQANIRALFTSDEEAFGKAYNVAYGERYTVNELYQSIAQGLNSDIQPNYVETRKGDIKNSLADISLAKKHLGYQPRFSMAEGIDIALKWYKENL